MQEQTHTVEEDARSCLHYLGLWRGEVAGALEPCKWAGEAGSVHDRDGRERVHNFLRLEDGEGGGSTCDQCVLEGDTHFQVLALEVKSPKEDRVGADEMPLLQGAQVM